MGNVWGLTTLVYNVLRQKMNVYLLGKWTQGPMGLTLNEINEFESFDIKRRYGHRLDAPVHPQFKLTIEGAENIDSIDIESDTIVQPRVKPDVDPIITPFDQLNLNCSTANAVSLLVQWFMYQNPYATQPYSPSRLYLYYEARLQKENDNKIHDVGVSFSDIFAVLNLASPVPDESDWIYSIHSVNNKPPNHDDDTYIPFVGVQLNPTLSNLNTCLKVNGPFIAAVTVTQEFELHAKYAYNPTDKVLGYQPLLFTNFSEAAQTFTAINSFGQYWGDRGKVTLHAADLFKDPVFTSSIYTLVPDIEDSDEEKSD